MKKYLSKPVLSVLAVATIAGGLTPVLANADDRATEEDNGTKVVMGTETEGTVRYSLKELKENNEALLELLLKTEADDLYVIVDEIDLDMKLSDLLEDEEKWQELLDEHLDHIYLEVRADEEDGFVKLSHETKDGVTYIKGNVASGVTRVVIETPNNEIKVESFTEGAFTASFPAVMSSSPVYVTLKAYAGDKLLDTEKLRINAGTVVEEDAVLHAMAVFHDEDDNVKVNGLVTTEADAVKVRYGDKVKEAKLKKLWSGVKAFSVAFDAEEEAAAEVVVEAYKDGEIIDSLEVDVINLSEPEEGKVTVTVKGNAVLSPKYKTVYVKGQVDASGDVKGELKLVIVAPDGKRHEVNLSDDHTFEAKLPYHNRSFSSKAVRVELYLDGKLVKQVDIPHGTPQNVVLPPVEPVKTVMPDVEPERGDDDDDKEDKDDEGKGKDKHKGKGHDKAVGKGHWKHKDKEHEEWLLHLNGDVKGKIKVEQEIEIEIED